MVIGRRSDPGGSYPIPSPNTTLLTRPGLIEIDLPDKDTHLGVHAFVNDRALGRSWRRLSHRVIKLAPGIDVYSACRPVSTRLGFDGGDFCLQRAMTGPSVVSHLLV